MHAPECQQEARHEAGDCEAFDQAPRRGGRTHGVRAKARNVTVIKVGKAVLSSVNNDHPNLFCLFGRVCYLNQLQGRAVPIKQIPNQHLETTVKR